MATLEYRRGAITACFAACAALQAWAQPAATQCNIVQCPVGSKVVSYAAPGDLYFACPTPELSDYTMAVMGLSSATYTITGHYPKVSPITGEPEYEGETADLLKHYRVAAGVQTFDQAVARCQKGVNGLKLVVLNNPTRGESVMVAPNGKSAGGFWMTKSHLDRR